MTYPDEDWLKKAVENKFYPPPKKKSIPRYIRRIRQRKAREKNEVSREIQRGIKLGYRCKHGVPKEMCIVCDPKYVPPHTLIDPDKIPF